MSSASTIELSPEHPPTERATAAFKTLEPTIKQAILQSRREWDQHEPRMWAAASGLSDEQLSAWDAERDVVGVRAGAVSYGVIIFGRIRIPALPQPGYVFVRIFDPSDEARSERDVAFHSIFTNEIRDAGSEGRIVDYRAVQTDEDTLEFFNE